MKKFNLTISSGKRKIIGSITFTYDKAFYKFPTDKIPYYAPNVLKISIYEGETEEQVRADAIKWYKKVRNIKIRSIGDQGGSL